MWEVEWFKTAVCIAVGMEWVNTISSSSFTATKYIFYQKGNRKRATMKKSHQVADISVFSFYGAVPDPSHIPCSCQHSQQCKQALTELFMLGEQTEPFMQRLLTPSADETLDRIVGCLDILHWTKETNSWVVLDLYESHQPGISSLDMACDVLKPCTAFCSWHYIDTPPIGMPMLSIYAL